MSIEIDGSVNSKDAIFLIDTGAASFSGSTKLANLYGIHLHDSGEQGHSFNGIYKHMSGAADTVAINGLAPAHKISFTGDDDDNDKRFSLGQNTLISMRALLDFNSSKIYTKNIDGVIDLQLIAKLNNVHSFDLMRSRNVPILQVIVNGKPARFLVDSGASYSLIDSTFCRKIGLDVNVNAKVIANGKIIKVVAWCDDFRVGECKFGQMMFAVVPLPTLACEDGEVLSGILGMDFLIATKSLIDVTGSKIYLSDINAPIFKFSAVPCFLTKRFIYDKLNNSKWAGRLLINHMEIEPNSMKSPVVNVAINASVLNKLKGDSGNDLKFKLTLDRRRFSNKLMIEAFVREKISRLVFLNEKEGVFTAQEDDLWPADVMIVQ